MDSELSYFQKIVAEVKKAIGIKTPVKVAWQYIDPCNILTDDVNKTIGVPQGFTTCFGGLDRDEIKAVIAHELGHIIHQDTKRYAGGESGLRRADIEMDADNFAGEHGFAKDSIRFMSQLVKHGEVDGGGTHPDTPERIKNFQQYL